VRYDAFLSYNRTADGDLAAGLRDALHRFGKPWYRQRQLRIYRDQTSMSAESDLWSALNTALDRSEYLILLASPGAARSRPVDREVEHWLATKGPKRLILVLTAGEIRWDQAIGGLDRSATTALPPALCGPSGPEPNYVDLREIRVDGRLLPEGPAFRDGVATISARLRGLSKDDVIGEDLRQHRRTLRLARIVIAALLVLLLGVSVASVVAVVQRNAAVEAARLALARLVAARASALITEQPLSTLLSLESLARTPTDEGRTSLLLARMEPARQSLVLRGHTAQAWSVAFSPHGDLVASGSADDTIRLWRANTGEPVGQPMTGHTNTVFALAFSPDGRMLASGGADGTVPPLGGRHGPGDPAGVARPHPGCRGGGLQRGRHAARVGEPGRHGEAVGPGCRDPAPCDRRAEPGAGQIGRVRPRRRRARFRYTTGPHLGLGRRGRATAPLPGGWPCGRGGRGRVQPGRCGAGDRW
jgi:hypothetical protein